MKHVTASSNAMLILRGTPYEMGIRHGKLLSDAIRWAIENLVHNAEKRVGIELRQLREKCSEILSSIPGAYLEEMAGIAEGASIEIEDIVALNCIMDVEASMFACASHCHNVILLPTASGQPEVMHGRNLDFVDTFVPSRAAKTFLRFPKDRTKLPTIAVSWVGHVGVLTGMNSAGISVGEVTSFSTRSSARGTPISMLIREMLEQCRDCDSAKYFLEVSSTTAGFNIAICDGVKKEALAVEIEPGRVGTRKPFRGYLVVDDVCLSKSMVTDRVCLPSGAFRHARMTQLVRDHYGHIDVILVKEFLQDRHDPAYGIRKSRMTNSICNRQTIQSVIFQPGQRSILINDRLGTMPNSPYRKIDLNEHWK